MVNGAPDDVVSWVPSGEAFRISNLSRLESETLPQYFRHSRFQSLVRQLNFYNFRKINRERTFWVYYHPLFHRDRPEEMHKLRRRTCPGFDGRRNRPNQSLSPPPPSANITWSNEDETVQDMNAEGQEESARGMALSHEERVKVSRSPSPSSSPMNHPPAGRGSVYSSATLRGPSLKPIVSEEEKSSSAMMKSIRRLSSLTSSSSVNGIMLEGQKNFYRTDCEDLEMNEYYARDLSSSKPPADLLQAEECVVDQLTYHLDAPNDQGLATFTKKSRKAKQTYSIWSDNDDDSSTHPHSSSRKKYSKEDLQERQDQLLAVADVSRHLNGICADYAASTSGCKPRSRGKGRGRLGAIIPGQAIDMSALPVYGLDKPHDHYYGAGKCDLLTYDCDDGFIIDDQDDRGCNKEKKNVVSPSKNPDLETQKAVTTPPSKCPLVNQSLIQACMEGKLVNSTSIFERTLASAILSFCLSTHPQDPHLAKKIAAHLKKGPMLAQEFDMYCNAMAPGVYSKSGQRSASDDLKRDWKMFSLNFIKRVTLTYGKHGQLAAAENEAIERCVTSWKFQEI